jgi:quercetin dioxygenase-like cupin family protein
VRVERWDDDRDGPLSEQAMRGKLERLGYVVSRYVYPPTTFFGDHRHPSDKVDAILTGQFRLASGGEVIVLGPGDAALVPAGVEHSAEVIGDQAVICLDGTKPS